MLLNAETRAWVELQAREAGFDLAGIADITPRDEASSAENARRFCEWVEAGRAGEMNWLERADEAGEMLRVHPQVAFPWARSAVVCAVNYNAAAPRSVDGPPDGSGWIARYAWSSSDPSANDTANAAADYHDVLLGRLQSLELKLRERFVDAVEMRSYVDTGPIVERNVAARAGVGWIGKNTCVLNQKWGSWLLLGVIVMSAEVADDALGIAAVDRCGTCMRCIDACPTDALIAPRQMDASRCISYLTIEKKGSISEELRPLMGRQVFGCDICQDVCPWNRKAPIAAATAWPVREELVNPPLEWLAAMDAKQFKRAFRGSPLERTGRKRMLRNVAIAMGNSGDAAHEKTLRDMMEQEDVVVKDAAAWALRQLNLPDGQ